MTRTNGWIVPLAVALSTVIVGSSPRPATGQPQREALTKERVDRAIRDGVRFLKREQERTADGSWTSPEGNAKNTVGLTALAALTLMTAGEPATARNSQLCHDSASSK